MSQVRIQWAELFLGPISMARSMESSELPGLVSSTQTCGKGTEMGSALLKHVDQGSLKRCGFIIRERMVKKGDRQISKNTCTNTFKKQLTQMFCIVTMYLFMPPICKLPSQKLELQGDKDKHRSCFHGACILVEKADIKNGRGREGKRERRKRKRPRIILIHGVIFGMQKVYLCRRNPTIKLVNDQRQKQGL